MYLVMPDLNKENNLASMNTFQDHETSSKRILARGKEKESDERVSLKMNVSMVWERRLWFSGRTFPFQTSKEKMFDLKGNNILPEEQSSFL